MKKFTPVFLALLFVTISALSAQPVVTDTFSSLSGWTPVHGTWKADNALIQSNIKTGLAMINRKLPQSGVYQLEYTASYLSGGFADQRAADMGKYHAGFGLHIGIDKPAKGPSWGNGKSYLLWFNLDTIVPPTSAFYGLRAQVYKSVSNSIMTLMSEYNEELIPADLIQENIPYLSESLYFKMIVDTDSGEVKVFDPTLEDHYYSLYLEPSLLKGSYIALRTNTVSIAFKDLKVTPLR